MKSTAKSPVDMSFQLQGAIKAKKVAQKRAKHYRSALELISMCSCSEGTVNAALDAIRSGDAIK